MAHNEVEVLLRPILQPTVPSNTFLAELNARLTLIEEVLDHPFDIQARNEGWVVLISGEDYNATISSESQVFICKMETGLYEAWRETWKKGSTKSVGYKVIATDVPFAIALVKATSYANYFCRGCSTKQRKHSISGIED